MGHRFHVQLPCFWSSALLMVPGKAEQKARVLGSLPPCGNLDGVQAATSAWPGLGCAAIWGINWQVNALSALLLLHLALYLPRK